MIMETAVIFSNWKEKLSRDSKSPHYSKWERIDVDFSNNQIPWANPGRKMVLNGSDFSTPGLTSKLSFSKILILPPE